MICNVQLIGFEKEDSEIDSNKIKAVADILKINEVTGYINLETQEIYLSTRRFKIYGDQNRTIIKFNDGIKFPFKWHPEKDGRYDHEFFISQLEAIKTLSIV